MSQPSFETPHCTADTLCFRFQDERLELLLIERKYDPFEGYWALPGGFIEMNETVREAALRELEEETGLTPPHARQFRTYGGPDRDPRGPVVTVCFLAFFSHDQQEGSADSDARRMKWHPALNPPSLAFDHQTILREAIRHLRDRLRRTADAIKLLDQPFSFDSLHTIYEHIFEKSIPRAPFEACWTDLRLIEPNRHESDGSRSESRLYRFNPDQADTILRNQLPLSP